MAFIRIDQIVRLNDDLIVDAINLIDRMMMTYEKRDPIGKILRKIRIFKKFCNQSSTFFFLIFSVRISVFYPAERAGNIVNQSCHFNQFLSVRIELFPFCNHFCISVNFHEMIDVMKISVRIVDHLLCGFQYRHSAHLRMKRCFSQPFCPWHHKYLT